MTTGVADVSRGHHGAVRVQSRRNPLSSPVSENSSIPPLDDDPKWGADERRDADRRRQPTRPWTGIWGPLRRARGRRKSDEAGYVDRYTRRDVALILAVFVMNVGDAFFTMLWLDRGGKEANPVMDFFLDIGPGAFLIQKCIVVGAWLVVLLVHKNFRFARIGLYVSLVVYAVLMLIHFGIIALGIEPPDAHDDVKSKVILERDLPQAGDLLQTGALAVDDSSEAVSRRVDRSTLE